MTASKKWHDGFGHAHSPAPRVGDFGDLGQATPLLGAVVGGRRGKVGAGGRSW
jgi:hypothetical protein